MLNSITDGSCKIKTNNLPWELAMGRSLTKWFQSSGWSESVIGIDLRKNVERTFGD